MEVLTTKVTKKGQITIPLEFRKELDLGVGSVVKIRKSNHTLIVEKPKMNLMKLKGTWKDMSGEVFEKMKRSWSRWNEKSPARY